MATKILMVCLGNICRSPLAEGVLRSKIDPNSIEVDSAGTGGYHIGSTPDERSIAVGFKYGIDISSQRCRKFNRNDFEAFDLIYAMDSSNYDDIIALAKNEDEVKKVRLLLDGSDSEIKEVPDPYYGGMEGFENVFRIIEKACTRIALELKSGEIN